MLYLLSGNIQIGKTRWLSELVERLESRAIQCDGVLAPGVWETRIDGSFDKLGIDNITLPNHTKIRFADRADIAQSKGSYDGQAQSAKAGLRWHIYDSSINYVNEYLNQIQSETTNKTKNGNKALIIDELGQLELLRNQGLTEALNLLDKGPNHTYQHAIVIARDAMGLPKIIEERYAKIWGGFLRISPNDESALTVLSSFSFK